MRLPTLLALVACSSAPAFAQAAVPFVAENGDTADLILPGAIEAHPDGGVLASAMLFRFNQPAEASITRYAESGEVVWSTKLDVPPSALVLRKLELTQAGTLLVEVIDDVTFNELAGAEVYALDSDGQLLWRTRPGVSPGVRYAGGVFGFGASGDVFTVGQRIGPLGATITALRTDAATGAEVWRTDVATVPSTDALRTTGGVAPNGDLVLVYEDGTGFSTARLSADGQVLHAGSTGLSLGIHPFRTFSALAFDSAGVAFGSALDYPDRIIFGIDAAGDVATSFLCEECDVPADFFPNGDLLVPRIGALSSILRTDRSGNVVWETPTAPNGFYSRSYDRPQPRGDGGYTVVVRDNATGLPTEVSVQRLDADGNLLSRFPLTGTTVPGTYPRLFWWIAGLDVRGNLWFNGRIRTTSAERSFVAPVIEDGTSARTLCVQANVNSTGEAGELAALGSNVAARGNVTLLATELPADQTVMFLNGTGTGFVGNVGGSDGDLCLGGTISRYSAPGLLRSSGPLGRASLALDLAETPFGATTVAVMAGETWNFQAWHRDTGPAGSHLTSAVSVTFE